MELLRRHDVALEGAEAVVVGRSDLVGKPVAALLLAANATVTTCHSRTRDLAEVCRRADVLVAAVGRPELVQGDWVKEGATVIDVGINRTDAGLVGDVEFAAAAERARLITPVPGGVGPMTIAMLLRNTLRRRSRRRHEARPRREMVAGAGGVVLLVRLFLAWYRRAAATTALTAWEAFARHRRAARAGRAARDRARGRGRRRAGPPCRSRSA